MDDKLLVFFGIVSGIALAFFVFYLSSRKNRIERLEKDVEELKKKDTITENSIVSINQLHHANKAEIALLRASVDKLDSFMHEQERQLKSTLNEVVLSALQPILVEIKHINKAIDDLKK